MDRWHWPLLALVDHRFGGRPGRLLPARLQLPTVQGTQLRSNLLLHRALRHVPTYQQLKESSVKIQKRSKKTCHTKFRGHIIVSKIKCVPPPEAKILERHEKRRHQLQVTHICLLWPKTHLRSSSKEFHGSPRHTCGCQDTDLTQPVGDTYAPLERSDPSG